MEENLEKYFDFGLDKSSQKQEIRIVRQENMVKLGFTE